VQLEVAARAQVDLRAGVAEPRPEVLCLGEQRPDALRGGVDEHVSFDPVDGHRGPPFRIEV
jgi:hypothetical protein